MKSVHHTSYSFLEGGTTRAVIGGLLNRGITSGAPSGYHDDCVMALALANHRRWETESCGSMLAVGDGRRSLAQSRKARRERVVMG